MTPTMLAGLALVLMLVLLALRMPVAFAMLAVGLLGSTWMLGPEAALQLLAADVYGQLSSYVMAIVPLFILMGNVMYHTGTSTQLFEAAYRWIGHLPGGLAATTILASIGFSAVSGSNSASTATMGSVALPEMKKYRYDHGAAGGAVAIGGTLGILLPPSTALIIIAAQSEQSITALFQAALFPGLFVGALLVATAILVCWRKPSYGPAGPKSNWSERFTSLAGVLQVLVLFAFTIGGMLRGLFTPTEAAAVGAFGAIVIGVVGRNLSWSGFKTATISTLRTSAMVVLLIASAVVFGRFLAVTRMPFELAEWVAGLPLDPIWVLMVIILIYLLAGTLMDALGFLVISIPIFFPLALALDYDLVWFTVVVTLVTTLGAVTPPTGVNVFIVSGMDRDMDTFKVFRGVFPYYIPYAIALAVFIAWPGTILFAVT